MNDPIKTFTEPNREGDVVKYSVPDYSYKDIVIASGSGKLAVGTVLGKVTASGKYAPLSLTKTVESEEPEGSSSEVPQDNGTQIAAAVLVRNIDATSADVTTVAVVRLATVVDDKLIFPASIEDDDKNNAIEELEAAGIVTRKGA